MVYAIPIFKNGRCFLRFKSTANAPVVIDKVLLTPEFSGGGVPQILKQNIGLEPDQEIDYEVTDALVEYVAASTPEERITKIRFLLGFTPDDPDQPQGIYTVTSKGKNIVAFEGR
jgi:hypothetical protein